MMRRLMESVEAKRRGEKQGGFTLIELIVVVVIIGILAAVAIPSFLSQRTRAFDAATISDSRNVAVEMESFFAGNLQYPTAEQAATGLADVNLSSDVTLEVWVIQETSPRTDAFLIRGTHDRSPNIFILDSTGGQAPVNSLDDNAATVPTDAATFTITTNADGETVIAAP